MLLLSSANDVTAVLLLLMDQELEKYQTIRVAISRQNLRQCGESSAEAVDDGGLEFISIITGKLRALNSYKISQLSRLLGHREWISMPDRNASQHDQVCSTDKASRFHNGVIACADLVPIILLHEKW